MNDVERRKKIKEFVDFWQNKENLDKANKEEQGKIVSANKGINILNAINKQSEQNKNSNMTIEEINQEIKNYQESL